MEAADICKHTLARSLSRMHLKGDQWFASGPLGWRRVSAEATIAGVNCSQATSESQLVVVVS